MSTRPDGTGRHRLAALVVVCALAIAACGSDDNSSSPAQAPSLLAGGSVIGTVEIDDTDIEYLTVVPAGFEIGDTAPVLLALPPGGQDLELTRNIVAGVYQREALRRGWVVVSPVAPGGELYFDGAERHVPELLDFIESWVSPEGGAIHLAGISNGGISAFRIAALNPDRLASIVVFPGFARSDADAAALEHLSDIPVRMYVGAGDTGWIPAMEETEQRLRSFGGDVRLEIVPNEGHVIQSLTDGVRIFDDLDAAR